MSPALKRPLNVLGGLLMVIGTLMPWATFVLNDGAYPDKATLEFFDAPFGLTGFRLQLLLFGLGMIVVTFTRFPGRDRVLRAAAWGGLLVALVNVLFIAGDGGGLGAVTASDGAVAFGGVVALVGGIASVAGARGEHEPLPQWTFRLSRPLEWLVLVVVYIALLLLVAAVLTSGGLGGAADPYAGPIFLSFLAAMGAFLAALYGIGLLKWIGELSERHRLFSVVVLVLCAVALPLTEAGNEYWMTVATNIGVYAATAIGLNIVVGLAGLLDLGYVAFMGIGAVVAADLSGAAASEIGIHLPFILVAVIAAVIAGLFGAFVGSPTLRVRGDYLAIVTLAFGEIFRRAAQNNFLGLTGGANAIPNIPALSLFGNDFSAPLAIGGLQLPGGVLYYLLIVLLVGLVMFVFGNLKNSRIGRAWIAIREDEDVARAMGIKTGKAKILAFLTGATLAGVAGAVFAHKTASVSYESFQFIESVTLLAAVILGGMGTVPGAVLGAAVLFTLPEKLREFADYRLLLFGAALVVIMRLRPQGLIPDRHRRAELAGEDESGESLEDTAIKQPVAVAGAKEAGA